MQLRGPESEAHVGHLCSQVDPSMSAGADERGMTGLHSPEPGPAGAVHQSGDSWKGEAGAIR